MVGTSDISDVEKDAVQFQKSAGVNRYRSLDAQELTQIMINSHDVTYRHFSGKGQLAENYMLSCIASIPQVHMTRCLDAAFVMDTCHERKSFSDSVVMFGQLP